MLQYLPADLVVPVAVYCAAIATMAARAYVRPPGFLHASNFLGAVGAFTFMVSDSVLAINKFVLPFGAAQTIVMVGDSYLQFPVWRVVPLRAPDTPQAVSEAEGVVGAPGCPMQITYYAAQCAIGLSATSATRTMVADAPKKGKH